MESVAQAPAVPRPRAERAAIEAAGELSIPSVCLVDLFAVDEKRWIGRPGYADRVCVLNEGVRQMLLAEGRTPDEVVVTGNPAFDGLFDPAHRQAAMEVRGRLNARHRKVALYAPSPDDLVGAGLAAADGIGADVGVFNALGGAESLRLLLARSTLGLRHYNLSISTSDQMTQTIINMR